MKTYRVHITCPALHITYQDFKTKAAAIKCLNRMQDKSEWYATHIEIINN